MITRDAKGSPAVVRLCLGCDEAAPHRGKNRRWKGSRRSTDGL